MEKKITLWKYKKKPNSKLNHNTLHDLHLDHLTCKTKQEQTKEKVRG
jgi:hypothetical protein